MKTAIIAIARYERRYMEEWFEYHSDLGINKFFIINNEDEDDKNQETLLNKLKQTYDITVINVRGPEALKKIGMQRGAYNYAYNYIRMNEPVVGKVDWVTFIDLDEFLWLDGKRIDEFLSNPVFNDTNLIHLNWRIYNDNDQMYYNAAAPVQKRFTKMCPLNASYNGDEKAKGVLENMFVKQILRVSPEPCMVDVHTTYFNQTSTVICRRADGSLTDWRWSADRINANDTCYVKHYITKSLEEYIDRRCVNVLDAAREVTPLEKRIAWYFNINEKTPEKVAYVKERLGLDV